MEVKTYGGYKMRLLIKQRVFSWTDTYDVFDEWENPKYFVKAEFFSLGHQIHIFDKISGLEVGVVHQKLLTLMPKFLIEIDGTTVGTIQKKFTLLRPKYEIDCNGWRVEGDFLGWHYNVMMGSSTVMSISKEPFHWGDTYIIDFRNPTDEIMGLLLAIAIDTANCSNKN